MQLKIYIFNPLNRPIFEVDATKNLKCRKIEFLLCLFPLFAC